MCIKGYSHEVKGVEEFEEGEKESGGSGGRGHGGFAKEEMVWWV